VLTNHSWAWALPLSLVNISSETPLEKKKTEIFLCKWVPIADGSRRGARAQDPVWFEHGQAMWLLLLLLWIRIGIVPVVSGRLFTWSHPYPLALTVFPSPFCMGSWALREGN